MLAIKFALLFVFVCDVQGFFLYIDVSTDKPVFSDQAKIEVIDNFLYEVEVRKIREDVDLSENIIQGNKEAEGTSLQPTYIETYDVISANKLEEDATIHSGKDVKERVKNTFAVAAEKGIVSRTYLKQIHPKILAFVNKVIQHFSDFKFYVPEEEKYDSPHCIFFLDVKNLKLYVFKDLVYKIKL